MTEWFVVAFLTFAHTDQIEIKLMQESFSSRPACVAYVRNNPDIVNDMFILEPNNNGMRFECLDADTVKRYGIKRKAI